MPLHSAVPNSFAIPAPLPAASNTFDFNPFLPNEFDWSRSSIMDIDSDDQGWLSATSPMMAPTPRKLEFANADLDSVDGLGGLDISFDATPSDNGKIRVRIHPSSSASSRAASPGASSSDSRSDISSSPPMWLGSENEPSLKASFSSQSPDDTSSSFSTPPLLSPDGDPFLGIGASDYSTTYYSGASPPFGKMNDLLSADYGSLSDLSYGSELSLSDTGKRRVRIALKSMPSAGGEGGEWEVQLC